MRAGHEAGEISVSVIERILNELHGLDEQFLEDVNRRVPVIIQALQNLRSQEMTNSVTPSQLDPIVCQVNALYDLANRVQASMMTMFLHRLRSFLLYDLANRVQASMMTMFLHGLRSLLLYDLANRVQASMMTMILHSLRSFLPVSVYRKTSTRPQWLQVVEARVQILIPMAEQWVNIGRTERADISEILRA